MMLNEQQPTKKSKQKTKPIESFISPQCSTAQHATADSSVVNVATF